jgi:hypothetical protein
LLQVTVGLNHCRADDVRLGCCRSFGVGCRRDANESAEALRSLTRFNNMHTAWEMSERVGEAHRQAVRRHLTRVGKVSAGAMRAACEDAFVSARKAGDADFCQNRM